MRKNRFVRSARSGFTLVELLVVIVIIAILASFLVVGVMSAMGTATEGRIRAELMGLAGAMEQYKLLYGEYPPSDPTEIEPHLNRIFPRSLDKLGTTVDGVAIPAAAELTEDELLYFWLAGYDENPRKPLTGNGERRPLFDFDLSRLKDNSGRQNGSYGFFDNTDLRRRHGYAYFPRSSERPYVYFRKLKGAQNWPLPENVATNYSDQYWVDGAELVITPVTVVEGTPVTKDFQIISAGLEERYDPKTNIMSFQDGSE